jgi:hypothetical protein
MADSTTKKVFKILKKLGTIWHPDSTLVFKSQKDKRVIGRYVDGELVPFDETALELCSEWDFKYDESLVDDNSDGEAASEGGEDAASEGGEEAASEGGEEAASEGGEDAASEGGEEAAVEAASEGGEEAAVEVVSEEAVCGEDAKEVPSKSEQSKKNKKADVNEYDQMAEHIINNVNIFVSSVKYENAKKSAQCVNIQNAYDRIKEEYTTLQAEHEKLQAKFEGIKKLFS